MKTYRLKPWHFKSYDPSKLIGVAGRDVCVIVHIQSPGYGTGTIPKYELIYIPLESSYKLGINQVIYLGTALVDSNDRHVSYIHATHKACLKQIYEIAEETMGIKSWTKLPIFVDYGTPDEQKVDILIHRP